MRVGAIHYGLDRQAAGIGRYTMELAAALSAQGISVHRLWAGRHPPGAEGEALRGAYLLPGTADPGPGHYRPAGAAVGAGRSP